MACNSCVGRSRVERRRREQRTDVKGDIEFIAAGIVYRSSCCFLLLNNYTISHYGSVENSILCVARAHRAVGRRHAAHYRRTPHAGHGTQATQKASHIKTHTLGSPTHKVFAVCTCRLLHPQQRAARAQHAAWLLSSASTVWPPSSRVSHHSPLSLPRLLPAHAYFIHTGSSTVSIRLSLSLATP